MKNKLKKYFKENPNILGYILELSRADWLAYSLGYRNTITIVNDELKYFEKLPIKFFKQDFNEEITLINRYPTPFEWDENKSHFYNMGTFLEYPESAILNFNLYNPKRFYCLDYKIFAIDSNNEALFEEIKSLPYNYISKEIGYEEATIKLITEILK